MTAIRRRLAHQAARLRSGRAVARLALVGVIGALLVGGVVQVRVDTGTATFVPAGDPSAAAMEAKAADFGGEPVVVLLRSAQPRALLTESDNLLGLLRLEGELAKLRDVASVYGPATVLNQVAATAQRFLVQVAGARDGARLAAEQQAAAGGLPPAEVREAGDRAAEEVSRRYAPLLLRGLPIGLPTLSNPTFPATVVFGDDGEPRPRWRAVVPAADSVAVLVRPREHLDQVGIQRLVASVRAAAEGAGLPVASSTISGVPAVTASLGARVAGEIPVLAGLVAVVVLLRFLLLPAPLTRRQRWMPLAAAALGSAGTLAVFGWAGHPLSFGAVALLPVLLGIGSSFPLYLAVLRDRRPVLAVAAASALAFGAMCLSPLPFVRDLGLALGIGVALTVAAALLLGGRAGGGPAEAMAPVSPGRRGRAAVGLVAVVATVAAALGWAVLPRLDVHADPRRLAGGLPALADAAEVERVLGFSGEFGLVLRGPDVLTPEALSWARAAEAAVVTGFGDRIRPVLGAPGLFSFLGDAPAASQIDAAFDLVPAYLSSAIVRPDRTAAVQVFGLRLQDLGAQTAMLADVRAAIPPPPPGYRADLVGLPVAAGQSYLTLLGDRYLVNLAGIALAGLVLLVGLRRRADAARAVAAAVLASGWGFALLWLAGLALSPLTVGLGALVTVTGCEFAVLLLVARRQDGAWLRRSVWFACLTSAAGYLALAVSGLDVVREFGLVLGTAVLLSYAAAAFVVWATTRPRAPHPEIPAPAQPAAVGAC